MTTHRHKWPERTEPYRGAQMKCLKCDVERKAVVKNLVGRNGRSTTGWVWLFYWAASSAKTYASDFAGDGKSYLGGSAMVKEMVTDRKAPPCPTFTKRVQYLSFASQVR